MRHRPTPAIAPARWLAALLLASLPLASAQAQFPPLANPQTLTHIPGKFVWFDLATSDLKAAQRFYGDVFGWKFSKLRGVDEDYFIARAGTLPVAGVFRPAQAPRGVTTARWLSFASTPDIGAALSRLTAGGATVLVPATKVPGRGTHALLRDSQGAIVGLLQSESGDRPDAAVSAGEFFWVDLYARDPEAAARAYANLGFDVQKDAISGDSRIVLAAKGYARAGIMKLPDVAREPGWLPYVQVDDVPATLERVRARGGRVLREPDPAVLNGQFAVFSDPQGGVIGVLHWDHYGEVTP